ncbi:hypothetical protein [Aquimarina litoralis]|uniref:hypothetical protein n=1 Tax=Aquimarina litoralis TaxID=584605 RepID=UPI001C581A78|nr:hypothetical protein [Aquimarina litoralis]MBW1294309.1 hypothetical protein [Aquimarina litoralis]
MFKSILSSKRYWISVARLGVAFILLISLIEYLKYYFGNGSEAFLAVKINNGLWVRYLLSRVLGGLAYGMIQAYYFERRKHKSNQ